MIAKNNLTAKRTFVQEAGSYFSCESKMLQHDLNVQHLSKIMDSNNHSLYTIYMYTSTVVFCNPFSVIDCNIAFCHNLKIIVYTHTHMRVHARTHTHECIHTHTHTNMHACTHAQIHTHTQKRWNYMTHNVSLCEIFSSSLWSSSCCFCNVFNASWAPVAFLYSTKPYPIDRNLPEKNQQLQN